MNCQGPCLLRCYTQNTVTLLIIGIFIGILISEWFKKSKINSGYFNSETD